MKRKTLHVMGGIFLFLCLAVSSPAQEKGWETRWNEILEPAKKEGRVVVTGSPDQAVRRDLPAAFKKRYGITLEYLGGRAEIVERLRMERRAGFTSIDVFFAGITTFVDILYPEKMLDPVKPVLVHPEVTDLSKWKKGKLWFMDPEDKYVLRLYNYVSAGGLAINTQIVKPGEINSVKELIAPRWKGKISAFDPRGRGPGSTEVIMFQKKFGNEFVRRLYVDQGLVLSRDGRQLADWLARGTYPVSFARLSDVKYMKEQGFPVDVLALPDAPAALGAGNGIVGLVNQAPHPYAARVFLNWIASKEGLEILGRARGRPTTRNDIDESYAPPWEIPRPGVDYFDTVDWDFNVNEFPKVDEFIRRLLASR
jgi:iron(III) transport system substrate-binding protein